MSKLNWTCAATSLLVALLAVPALAEIPIGTTTARIPFDFIVSGKALPAGEYTFNLTPGQQIVTLRNGKGDSALMALPRAVTNTATGRTSLSFTKQNGKYYLNDVWSGGAPKIALAAR